MLLDTLRPKVDPLALSRHIDLFRESPSLRQAETICRLTSATWLEMERTYIPDWPDWHQTADELSKLYRSAAELLISKKEVVVDGSWQYKQFVDNLGFRARALSALKDHGADALLDVLRERNRCR